MRFFKGVVLFFLGGVGYVTLECLWRGRSHSSMFLAGGTCFLLLGKLDKLRSRLFLPIRGLLGTGIITAVELLTGLLFNRDHRVWDYRDLPANFRGQICLRFSLLWIPLSLGAMTLHRFLNEKLRGFCHCAICYFSKKV